MAWNSAARLVVGSMREILLSSTTNLGCGCPTWAGGGVADSCEPSSNWTRGSYDSTNSAVLYTARAHRQKPRTRLQGGRRVRCHEGKGGAEQGSGAARSAVPGSQVREGRGPAGGRSVSRVAPG